MSIQHVPREEHLARCKSRALKYLDNGDLNGAFTSFLCDMDKHPETRIPAEGTLAMLTMLAMHKLAEGDHDFIKRYIIGWN